MAAIRRAILSVSDKSGIVDFAKALADRDIEILSSGGTFKLLTDNGIPAIEVAEFTGFPEMLDGRVKTLHPKIYAGILARRDVAEHMQQLQAHDLVAIDLVVVNLYPFANTIAKPDVTVEDAIENIDIGGPSLLRAAAKNHSAVAVVTQPSDYSRVLEAVQSDDGNIPAELLRELAVKAYAHTAAYDTMISTWFAAQYNVELAAPDTLQLSLPLISNLRYGENPHQSASVYRDESYTGPSVANAKKLNGKALSYNNLLDADAAMNLVREFSCPAAAVIKHNNPCGAGIDEDDLVKAFDRAYEGDPLSAYGSVVALNRPVTAATADRIAQPNRFVEVVIAPSFDEEAITILTTKQKWGKNLRLLAVGDMPLLAETPYQEIRSISGGLLRQDKDIEQYAGELTTASKREPTADELRDLKFAWCAVKHGRSNGIAIAKDNMLTGLGAGQMSRVDATRIAIDKSGDRVTGAVLASDAFFPFSDSIEAIAAAGITAIIQPGGSIRDQDVIDAADAHNLAMVFTGQRHFRH